MGCGNDDPKREISIRMARKFWWSRNVLIHRIENLSYEKTLLGQTSFDRDVAPAIRAQARPVVKDEYTFDSLELGEEHRDRELEHAIIYRVELSLRTIGGPIRR